MKVVGSMLYNPTGRTTGDVDFLCLRSEWKDYLRSASNSGRRITKLTFDEENGKSLAIIDGLPHEASFIDHHSPMRQSDKEVYGIIGKYPPEEVVFLLKWSHRFKKNSVHFNKTRNDIKALEDKFPGIREKVLNGPLETILRNREKATYTNTLPSLNQGKNTFFTDNIPYIYDHDSIHEAVKYLDKPAYMYYISDNEDVLCSKEKWESVDEIVRLYGVLEESYVLALERAIIPHGTEPYKAFKISLEKVCTSITSGWFREFAWDNYDMVLSMYSDYFVHKFNDALREGRILPYRGGKYGS